jgi:phospholipid/cholesterol/gamma-HCH transport system ATP-binding protein
MIQIRNLHKQFDGRVVLEDVSLDVNYGETFSIIGRSGSGNSLLMKHIVAISSLQHQNIPLLPLNLE